MPREQLERDVTSLLDALYRGGIGIVPLDVAYAIVGHSADAIRRIFAAKRRSYEKPSGLLADWRTSEEIHVLPDEKRAMIRTVVDRGSIAVLGRGAVSARSSISAHGRPIRSGEFHES